MKRILIALVFCFVGLKFSYAQQSGAQALRLAQSVYEQGRLHELPDLINKNIGSFTKPELVSAYRLLTLSYIYLEEPEKADESMLKLLDADHFYVPNDKVEPAEFMGLYKTFRTKPVFNVGLKFGVNSTVPLLNSIYYVANSAPGKGKYTPKVGFQVGAVFEKEIFHNSKNAFLKRVVFAPEVFYSQRTFSYVSSSPSVGDSTIASDATQSAIIKQNWLDINPVFQLKFGKKDAINFIPYLGIGPGLSYMLGSKNTMLWTWTNTNVHGSVNGADVDFTKSYHKLVPSIIGLAGVKYRFNSVYLVGEFRVQYGLTNPVNNDKRSNITGAYDYQYQLPNYKPLNLTVNLGITYPYFNPLKLKRK